MMDQEAIDRFLIDLTELSRKHGIVIHGCGCCGSPSLYELKDREGRYVYNDDHMGPDVEWAEPQHR